MIRILPSMIFVWSWVSMAMLSCSSLMNPRLMRNCPRYSRGSEEAVERMEPLLKKMRLVMPLRGWRTWRMPVPLALESH